MDMTSFLLGYKSGQKAGGGSSGGGETSEYLRWVTFMSYDGSVEYGKKAVAVGDDCADPIARGIFETPTKESTAQYDYSFVGWATTPNGAWDESALDAVTEDRTVYAAYAAAVRYYTVSFYDGDTLLTTKQVAYGGSTTYDPPAKDGYFFDTWEPSPENITGDLSCYAQYKMDIDFATATWADIAAVSEAGEAANYFAVGNTKSVSFTAPDGTSHTMPVEIIAFNHDELEDGTKAGITLRITKATAYVSMNNANKTYNGASSGYGGGWELCDLRATLNSTTLASMPTDLQNAIKSVKKISHLYADGTDTTAKGTTYDKLWCFSAGELFSSESGYGVAVGDGVKYSNLTPAVMQAESADSHSTYWLRSASYANKDRCGTCNSGSLRNGTARNVGHVVFGFCI